jgi:hypothetical protein
VSALLACPRVRLRHAGCVTQVPNPEQGAAKLSGVTPVALALLLPLIKRDWESFENAVATQRTAMLRHLLPHEAQAPDFVPDGPVVCHGESELGVVALAAYMCHALPMHSMLLVRLPMHPAALPSPAPSVPCRRIRRQHQAFEASIADDECFLPLLSCCQFGASLASILAVQLGPSTL